MFVPIPSALKHLVNSLTKEERNLCPAPPKRAEKNLENRKSKEHVRRVKKMPDKEGDGGNGDDRKYQTGDER